MRDDLASLNEDLSAEPMRAGLQAELLRQIEAGADPRHLVEAAFVSAAALCVDVSGLTRTALYMLKVGSTLAASSPAIQAHAARLQDATRTAEAAAKGDAQAPTAH